eukprot:UN25494
MLNQNVVNVLIIHLMIFCLRVTPWVPPETETDTIVPVEQDNYVQIQLTLLGVGYADFENNKPEFLDAVQTTLHDLDINIEDIELVDYDNSSGDIKTTTRIYSPDPDQIDDCYERIVNDEDYHYR